MESMERTLPYGSANQKTRSKRHGFMLWAPSWARTGKEILVDGAGQGIS